MHVLPAFGWRVATALALLATSLATSVALVGTTPASADSHDFDAPVFSTDARGDITTIGNVTTTCDPTYENQHWSAAESAAACNGATSGASNLQRFDGRAMPPINNRFSMVEVDVDSDPTTSSSSTARLTIPSGSTVLWAGLHWNAATAGPVSEATNGSTYTQPPRDPGRTDRVRLATPASGGYLALQAEETWTDLNPGGTASYGGYAEVTDLVQAAKGGDYTVADVQSCTGFGGCFGSWSLTVAFADESQPPRNLNVWHGWQLTTPSVDGGAQTFSVGGITPPPNGPVNARIGVVQADGDRGLGPDSLDISSASSPEWTTFATMDRPLADGEDDWFNSTVNSYRQRRPNTDATPNLLANLNQDIALVEEDRVIGNEDTGFSFRVQTAGTESLYSQVVHSAVDLYAPEIQLEKLVEPAGPITRGDELTWTLEVRNVGIDPIRRAVVTDPLPAGTTYVPGSVRYESGGPDDILGPKTDATGDDQVDWDPASARLTFRVGAGADASTGGTMATEPAADGSDALTITFRTVADVEPDQTILNIAEARGEGRELDDPFGPIETIDEAQAEIASAPASDLGITKDDDGATVTDVGDRFSYRLVATNAGPSAATGVSMTDALDDRLRFVGSDDGCTADGQAVTCPVGALAVGASHEVSFEVEVVQLPEVGEQIPNLALVTGNEPNPNCTEATPDALCDQDEEETPRTEPPTTTTVATTDPPTTTEPSPTTSRPTPKPTPTPNANRPTGALPRTGSAIGGTIGVGLALLLTGIAVALGARARRRKGQLPGAS